jgi:AraC family transcriptional regulator
MEYYNQIQNAINYIENHILDDLEITEIASKACFSAFHFQRLFHVISGFTVHEYIRKRRLTEAAKMLKETNLKVLEIAFTFQYNSQEAFTRTFVSYFGLDKINIIGYKYKTNLNNDKYFEEIPGFYHHFGSNEYYLQIPNKAKPDFPYGIGCNYQKNGDFSFIIGEEVHKLEKIKKGFVCFEIPEGKYAEFKVSSLPELGQNTWKYIYGTWLPNSNYQIREGPDFEVTDVRNSYPDKIEMKIYIPVK